MLGFWLAGRSCKRTIRVEISIQGGLRVAVERGVYYKGLYNYLY